jgi:dolichol kinase
LMFFLIDIINLKIDDNILNPIFCGLTMWIVYII